MGLAQDRHPPEKRAGPRTDERQKIWRSLPDLASRLLGLHAIEFYPLDFAVFSFYCQQVFPLFIFLPEVWSEVHLFH